MGTDATLTEVEGSFSILFTGNWVQGTFLTMRQTKTIDTGENYKEILIVECLQVSVDGPNLVVCHLKIFLLKTSCFIYAMILFY